MGIDQTTRFEILAESIVVQSNLPGCPVAPR